MKKVDNKSKWVVLDDDPTGIQTVHDVAVYTDWNKDTLEKALKEEEKLFIYLQIQEGSQLPKQKSFTWNL